MEGAEEEALGAEIGWAPRGESGGRGRRPPFREDFVEHGVHTLAPNKAVAVRDAGALHANLLHDPPRAIVSDVGSGLDARQPKLLEAVCDDGRGGLRREAPAPERAGDAVPHLRRAGTVHAQADTTGDTPLVDNRPLEARLAIDEDAPGHKLLGAATGVGVGQGEVASPLGAGGVGEHVIDIVAAIGAEEEPWSAEFGQVFHRESIRHRRALRETRAPLLYP